MSSPQPVLPLVPEHHLPPIDSIKSGLSDIFPYGPAVHLEGPLGDYRASYPNAGSPLVDVVKGLRADYTQHEAWIDSQDESVSAPAQLAMLVAQLQIRLACSIDRGYLNLVNDGEPKPKAIEAIEEHIEDRDEQAQAHYELKIDNVISRLAAVERGETVPAEVNNEKDLMLWRDNVIKELVYELSCARLREKRLQFEWLSARQLLKVLKLGIVI